MDPQALAAGYVSSLAVQRLLRRGARLGQQLAFCDKKLLADPISVRIEDYRNLRRRVLDSELLASIYSSAKTLEHEYVVLPALAQPLSLRQNISLADCFKPNAKLLHRYWSTEYITYIKENSDCAQLIFVNCTYRSPNIFYRLDIMLGAIADIKRLFLKLFSPILITLTVNSLDPAILNALQEFSGCRIELGNSCDSITIRRSDWEFILPADAEILSEARFPRLSELQRSVQLGPLWIEDIKSLIGASRHPQILNLKDSALRFETSVKTLERRLALYGENFQSLIDREVVFRSRQLLQNSAETLETIAEKLGFANASSFSNSFYRCTGVRPGAVRSHAKRGV